MGRIPRQSGIVFTGTIFTAVFVHASKVYLARMLGAEALGPDALLATIVSFLGTINMLGLPLAAVRFVPLCSASKKFQESRRSCGALLDNAGHKSDFLRNVAKAAPRIALRIVISLHTLVRYLPLFAPIMIRSALTHHFGDVVAG